MKLEEKVQTDPGGRGKELLVRSIKFGVLFALSLAAVFLIPNHSIDPWDLINPRLMLLVVVLVMGLQYVAYLVMQLWRKEGIVIMGALLGFVNSNIINGAMSTISKQEPKLSDYAASAVICGDLAMVLRNLILGTAISINLVYILWPPMVLMLATGAWITWRVLQKCSKTVGRTEGLGVSNPFEIKTAILFSLATMLVTIAGFFVHKFFGNPGLYLTACIAIFAAGVPIIASAALLAVQGHITFATAGNVILLASFMGILNDAILQLACGARHLAWSFLKQAVPIFLAGIVALGVTHMIF